MTKLTTDEIRALIAEARKRFDPRAFINNESRLCALRLADALDGLLGEQAPKASQCPNCRSWHVANHRTDDFDALTARVERAERALAGLRLRERGIDMETRTMEYNCAGCSQHVVRCDCALGEIAREVSERD